jgi:DNA-binding winged helix-turn-helix (wHTH) protein/Tfp pilus assembly protein PilF
MAPPAPGGCETYRFGPFRLIPAERLLLNEQKRVPLTPKALEVLEVLLHRAGSLVTKRLLLEAVWPDTFVEEGTVARNISEVRRALGGPRVGRRYIETISRSGYRFVGHVRTESRESGIRSVGVLPFQCLNGDPEDFIATGLADSLVTDLSRVPGIRVARMTLAEPGRASVDPLEAGRTLQVDAIVEGRLQKSSGMIRATARLLRVANGESLWAGKFDECQENLLKLQDTLSQRIVGSIHPALAPLPRPAHAGRQTQSEEAYEAFLRGRHYSAKYQARDAERALHHLLRAVEIDPDYALAWCGLAIHYMVAADQFLAADAAVRRAKQAVRRTLQLDPTLPEAHAVLGAIRFWNEFDRVRAERHFETALALGPAAFGCEHFYGWYLTAMGRFAEAERALQRAVKADPLSLPLNSDLGLPAFYGRDFSRAVQRFESAIEMDPNYWYPRYWLALARIELNDEARAFAELRQLQRLAPEDPSVTAAWGYALARFGQRRRAADVVRDLDGRAAGIVSFQTVAICAALGRTADACRRLQAACHARIKWVGWMQVDPGLDPLRSHPAFTTLLRSAGFAG